jgi:hypothetical protein
MDHTKRQGDMIGPIFAILATLGNFSGKILAQKWQHFWLIFTFYIAPLFISFNAWFGKYFLATLGNFTGKIVAQKVATFLGTFHILQFTLIYPFQCMVW